ncbi:hypothetical protein BDW74DRAFT_177560 [Aspergillus multicolor]|uniref:uncharacterized protein n=1 Tax=Aspergillus multicolor TaxID=41759 RepID=UPI003CCDA215
MAPPQALTTLVLGFILIAPLTTALPIPSSARDTSCNTLNPETGRAITARSPSPDPRMIPSQTDLMATIFAQLGMEELAKLNKLHPEEEDGNGATMVIDDSRSTTHTVTEQDNAVDGGKGKTQDEQAQVEQGKDKKQGKETEKGKDASGENADTAKDPEGFMGSLFEALRKKFREAINGSDEVELV